MRKLVAECIGTFVLVFGGVGSAVLAGEKIGFTGVSLAFGLSLLAMVYTIGPISGCHVNPAVTVGMLLAQKIGKRDAAGYVLAQCGGAIIAAGLLLVIANGVTGGYDAAAAGLGANGYGMHSPGRYALTSAFLTELVLTAFLVLTILGSTDIKAPSGFAGIAIGLVLTLIHLVGIPITNTSVNPARSLGPAVFVGGWAIQQLWLFIVSPLVGAGMAVAIWTFVRLPTQQLSTNVAETALPEDQAQRARIRRRA